MLLILSAVTLSLSLSLKSSSLISKHKTLLTLYSTSSSSSSQPTSLLKNEKNSIIDITKKAITISSLSLLSSRIVNADGEKIDTVSEKVATNNIIDLDLGSYKLPYNHQNLAFKKFIGSKATIVFNMKIDDPQTIAQFPAINEIYNKYKNLGLNIHAFPTEQGWFEPDDDETCRAKAEVYYGFGGEKEFPNSVVFDKIDILGPSAHPLYKALTDYLPTPNGYRRITLNYEKFLLDSTGKPVRRYPRKYSAYDMENDIAALLNDKPLPEETLEFQKAWKQAKREVIKSEYAFRYNYNYYSAPDSMYKYDEKKDEVIAS